MFSLIAFIYLFVKYARISILFAKGISFQAPFSRFTLQILLFRVFSCVIAWAGLFTGCIVIKGL
jgi:hypothetical protein